MKDNAGDVVSGSGGAIQPSLPIATEDNANLTQLVHTNIPHNDITGYDTTKYPTSMSTMSTTNDGDVAASISPVITTVLIISIVL